LIVLWIESSSLYGVHLAIAIGHMGFHCTQRIYNILYGAKSSLAKTCPEMANVSVMSCASVLSTAVMFILYLSSESSSWTVYEVPYFIVVEVSDAHSFSIY